MNKLMYVENAVIKIPFKKLNFDYKVFKRNSLNIYQSLTVKILAKNSIKVKNIQDLAEQISTLANIKLSLILDFLEDLESKNILVKDDFYKLEDRFLNFKSVDGFLVSFNIIEGKNQVVLGFNNELDLLIDTSNFPNFSQDSEYWIDSEVKSSINNSLLKKDEVIRDILESRSSEYELLKWGKDTPYLINADKVSNILIKFKVDLLYSLDDNNKSSLISLNFSEDNLNIFFDSNVMKKLFNSTILEKIIIKENKPAFILKLEESNKIIELSSELSKSNSELIKINTEIEEKVVKQLESLKIKRDTTPEQVVNFKIMKAKYAKLKLELEESKRIISKKNRIDQEKFQSSISPLISNSRFKKLDKHKKTHPIFIGQLLKLEEETNILFDEHEKNLNLFKAKIEEKFDFTHFGKLRIRFENLFVRSMKALSDRELKKSLPLFYDYKIVDYILKKPSVKLTRDMFDNAKYLKSLLDFAQHELTATPDQKKYMEEFLNYDIKRQKVIVYSIVEILAGIDFNLKELDEIESNLK